MVRIVLRHFSTFQIALRQNLQRPELSATQGSLQRSDLVLPDHLRRVRHPHDPRPRGCRLAL